ncbi:MAG: hypothetical protein IIW18_05990, partial [Oscillospiraceae bacterium]|nr:hypothetical protein [Oscillospiraceae bacterium]
APAAPDDQMPQFFNDIGKTFNELKKEHPEGEFIVSSKGLPGAAAACFGEEVVSGEGWLRFIYHDIEVMINTNEVLSGGGWNFTGEEIVKRNAPLTIVDPEMLKTNQNIADAAMFG